MSDHLKFELLQLQDEVASLQFAHVEGGKYAYVKFLSLIRDLGTLLPALDAEESKLLQLISHTMNERLCERLTSRDEAYFELSRSKVLRVLVRHQSANCEKERAIVKF